jgi:hypothetical protein
MNLVGLLACGPNTGPSGVSVPTGAPTPSDTSSVAPTEPIEPRGEAAAVALLQRAARAGNLPADTTVVGLFTDSLRGFVNLPMCVGQQLSQTFCAESLPTADDTWVVVQDFDDSLLDQVFTRRVGDEITVGPWQVPWFFDSDAEFGSYYGAVDATLVDGPLDIAWEGGDWDAFNDADVLPLPPPMVVTEPDPLAWHAFTDQGPVELAWEPSDVGFVVLAVSTWVEDRLYLLEDDGAYSLDLSELGLTDGEAVDLMLGRWNMVSLTTPEGHDVTFSAQSDQWIFGSWRALDGRTEIVPADACATVVDLTPVPAGSYWGDMLAFGNQIDPGLAGCTGFPAQGAEGVLPVEVPAKGLLGVSYLLPNDDASLYLVEACANPDTCLVGSDAELVGWEETVSWFNDSDETVSLYVVLDSYYYPGLPSISDIFLLDVTLDVLGGDVLHDHCADAMLAPAVGAGSYAGDLGSAVSDLDPSPFCAGEAPGGDGMVKVTLDAGQTLTATASMPGSDLVLYALYHCTVPSSCVVGADDARTGGPETLSYTNTSGVQENLYLVLDSIDLSAGYNLEITLQ